MKKSFYFALITFAVLMPCIFLTSCNPQVGEITIQGNSQENTTSPASLVSISLSGEPSKSLYFAGDEFDKTTLTVTATYDDGTSKAVTNYNTDFESVITNGKTLTVTYTENGITKTATMQGFYYVAAADALTSAPVKYDTIDIKVSATTRTYDIFKFGDFPQTVVPQDSTVTYSTETVYNDWYLGDDGYFYAKCTENGNHIRETQYTDGSTVLRNGSSYRYFKVEPIKWRVLTDNYNDTGKKLLLAENILINCMYYDYKNVNRTVNGTIHPLNYEHSKIRAYLNGLSYAVKSSDSDPQETDRTHEGKGFLQVAFSSAAQDLIATTTVDNSERSTNPEANDKQFNNGTNIYASDTPTYDKIFLLSTQEATTAIYGFDLYDIYVEDSNRTKSSSRIRTTTDFAKANGSFQETKVGLGGWWWLRSPNYRGINASDISAKGQVSEGALGSGGGDSSIVPALCLE